MPKKVAFCHYRVGGTDGVSLEIEEQKKILEKYGCEIKLIAGARSNGVDYIIKELEWDNGTIPAIKENGFLYFEKEYLNSNELKTKINRISKIIKDKLTDIQLKEKFDFVFIHNIFSFGGHIASAKAFTEWINKFKIPTNATHHDFFWEREEYRMPRSEYIRQYMQKYMPPKSPYINHIVINSLTQQELKKRHNIEATVFPDIFDFNQPKWKKDKFNKDFLKQFDIKSKDLIILQATRVIPRKGIELAIDFTKALQKNIHKLKGKRLYNGKKINSKVNVVLIIAGYAEDEKREYLFKLKTKIFKDRIHAKFISDNVKVKRNFFGGIKSYSLWDAYVYADLVTLPSLWESWGNQFIEAVFAKKPVVVFEYPVFKKDIKPEGYKVISLGNKIKKRDKDDFVKIPQQNINQAVQKTIKWLLDEDLNKKLDHNFKACKKFHGHQVLENFLVEKLKLKQKALKRAF